MLRIISIATYVVGFLCISWPIFFFFHVPSKMPVQIRWLSLSGLISFALEISGAFVASGKVPMAVGEVLLLSSLVLFWSAVNTARGAELGIAYARHEPRKMLREGPYRWIRHPFYSSYLLFWVGGAVASGDIFVAVVPAIMAIFYWFAAKSEEVQLRASKFGGEYERYMRRTGMFFPPILRR